MAFEDISGMRVASTPNFTGAATGVAYNAALFYTAWPLTIRQVVGVASGSVAGTVTRLRLMVNGAHKGFASATLTAGAGSRTWSFNGLTATAPAGSYWQWVQAGVAATGNTLPMKLHTFYHHGFVQG